MIEILLHGIVLTGLIITAVLVFIFKDLVSATIAFGIFSLLLALEFYLLKAPDVAITEAAIGAGLTTAAFLIAIRGTVRKEADQP
ncbi:MAG: DUF4040 domain-containing protein [Methanocalculus sp. MSAO_Arc1]|uniref:Na(+)/H(+) antiporter subunit B n=1 Tax=Methanocalculus TaxID=71151 RepID=UPI000FF43480|nr:hydrogenase subunit MbhD domain-containing protein [Methanocalculus sp. MSAO_Arc1]MCP1662789.1 putative MnhB-related membrane protein [Methanocalculus sp. AMF5]RQD81069.1 MAG: DUF4040 domain-containing protein [Methanocalculus sp. MSAO_Arc1]